MEEETTNRHPKKEQKRKDEENPPYKHVRALNQFVMQRGSLRLVKKREEKKKINTKKCTNTH